MIRFSAVIILIASCVLGFAGTQEQNRKIIEGLQKAGIHIDETCDSIFSYDGYSVRICPSEDSSVHIGLNLFSPEFKNTIGKETLDFIERELLYSIVEGRLKDGSNIELTRGKISDFRKIDISTPFNIFNKDSKELTIEWTPENNSSVVLTIPMSYETIHSGTRGEIEESFISKLKKHHSSGKNATDFDFDISKLEPYGESDYILPGPVYLNKNISRNIYLSSANPPIIIWDVNKPLESISNLFTYSPNAGSIDAELTILKHEYGEKELIKTNIENLLAVAEAEGCIPYWGVESFEGSKLIGSLFLYNQQLGYDHVVKVECIPEEIIEGKGKITATVFLYIPTNNVKTLDEPYRVKLENEKIKYK